MRVESDPPGDPGDAGQAAAEKRRALDLYARHLNPQRVRVMRSAGLGATVLTS
jgi:hypothetical protein